MANFTNVDKRCLSEFVFKTSLFMNLTIGMILALGARRPGFNSRNAPSNLSQQKVFQLCSRNLVDWHDSLFGSQMSRV